jgi:hypothetical protein
VELSGRVVRLFVLAVVAGALLVVPGTTAAPFPFPGGAYFAVGCSFSHRSNDDPIVYPEQPGRAHSHTFIGNRSTDAFSTPAFLLGGRTSCASEEDASAYWVPTLYEGDRAMVPLVAVVYYIKRTFKDLTALPAGLKMIAGDAAAVRRQAKSVVAWACGGIGSRPRLYTIPVCAQDDALQLLIHFPNCWNGVSLDSPDHKRHMRYSVAGQCPKSHPVAVPTIALALVYPAVGPGAIVSSGRLAVHADFMNGWDQAELTRLVRQLNR